MLIVCIRFIRRWGQKWNSFSIPTVGASSGISLFWLHSALEVKVISSHSHAIHAIITMSKFEPWLLTVIYASTNCLTRNTLWNALVDSCLSDIPWLLCGDFNAILNLEE